MFKSFLISMFAILLFTLGAAGSWFYLNMEQADTEVDAAGRAAATPTTAQASPIPQLDSFGDAPLPAIVRGPELDPEELYRIETATNAKRKQLREYEDRLREQKVRIKAADVDTKAAQREVDGAARQVRDMMDAAEKMMLEVRTAMDELKKESEEIQRQKDELKTLQEEVGADASANVRAFAEFMQSMPAAAAAETIKTMANDGKMDFAVQLLRNIETRNASKILEEIRDPELISEIAERYRDLPVIR